MDSRELHVNGPTQIDEKSSADLTVKIWSGVVSSSPEGAVTNEIEVGSHSSFHLTTVHLAPTRFGERVTFYCAGPKRSADGGTRGGDWPSVRRIGRENGRKASSTGWAL